jgi:hypothetical protein
MEKTHKLVDSIRSDYLDKVIGQDIYPRITGISTKDNPLAVVCVFFLRKATKSLDAICSLCEAGFHEDALVLARVIFEHGLNAQYMAAKLTLAESSNAALSFIYDGDEQRVTRLAHLMKLKSEGKCLSWISEIEASNPVQAQTMQKPANFDKKSLEKMALDVGGEWGCWYHFLYWSVSKLTHPSGLGSHTYLEDVDVESSGALSVALTLHYALVRAMLGMLGLESSHPDLEAAVLKIIKQP